MQHYLFDCCMYFFPDWFGSALWNWMVWVLFWLIECSGFLVVLYSDRLLCVQNHLSRHYSSTSTLLGDCQQAQCSKRKWRKANWTCCQQHCHLFFLEHDLDLYRSQKDHVFYDDLKGIWYNDQTCRKINRGNQRVSDLLLHHDHGHVMFE